MLGQDYLLSESSELLLFGFPSDKGVWLNEVLRALRVGSLVFTKVAGQGRILLTLLVVNFIEVDLHRG